MSEAVNINDSDCLPVTTPSAGYSAGEVLQLTDGRAGYVAGLRALTSGDEAGIQVKGRVTVTKTASVVILKGGRVYWDRSAGSATPLRGITGDNFYLGVAAEDAASADTTVDVDLNVKPEYFFDMHVDAMDHVAVGTVSQKSIGGQQYLAFTTASEAEKLDLLSVKSVPVTIPFVFEAIWRVQTAADADVGDFNIGVANDTHASDADSITESCFFHNDSGADLNLDAESDDGTTEVAATDTTVDIVAGTDVEVWIDARDLTDIQMYVNGVLVLPSTVFKLDKATGPLKALAHWEKSSNDTAGEVRVTHMAIRTFDVE